MNVVLGGLVQRGRLSRAQWTAVALAAIGVAYLTVLAGRPPWIAGTLAVSFSLYGLQRKVISVDALPGLAIETLLLLPLAVAHPSLGPAPRSAPPPPAPPRIRPPPVRSRAVTAD